MLYLFLQIYNFSIPDFVLLSWGININGVTVIMKVKALFYNIYDHIYREVESVARRALQMNRAQPELVRVPESVLEQSGVENAREAFDYRLGSPPDYYR